MRLLVGACRVRDFGVYDAGFWLFVSTMVQMFATWPSLDSAAVLQ